MQADFIIYWNDLKRIDVHLYFSVWRENSEIETH